MERIRIRPLEGRRRSSLIAGACTWGVLGWTLSLMGSIALGGEAVSKEYQLKAAFLYNFAKFVEWDAQSSSTASGPIVIAVLGENPFGAELEKAVRDRKINGRAIVVRSVQNGAAASVAHLLFISDAEDSRFGDIREVLKGKGVLTVGESEAFAKRGGIINFVLEGDKLRFEINIDSAEQAGLKVSAQLQKLARAVRRKS